MAKITPEEIKLLSPYIFSLSGIFFDQSKKYLMQSRLAPLLPQYDCNNFTDLYHKAVSDERVKNGVIDAVTTNETFFFRDKTPFELLQFKILPEIIDRKKRERRSTRIPIKIWSAASSTGQEAYTIAMVLKEVLPDLSSYDVQILGTDLSRDAYARASYGLYSQFEVKRGLPQPFLKKYFKPFRDGWRIDDEIRILTRFENFNLLHSFARLGTFDIIFCRNVAIYFVNDDKVKLFRKIKQALNPRGYLLVGGSESLSGMAPDFEMNRYLNGIYYQPIGSRERVKSKEREPVHKKKIPPLRRKRLVAPPKPLRELKEVKEVKTAEPVPFKGDEGEAPPHKVQQKEASQEESREKEGGQEEMIPEGLDKGREGSSSLLSSIKGRTLPEKPPLMDFGGRRDESGKEGLLKKIKKRGQEDVRE